MEKKETLILAVITILAAVLVVMLGMRKINYHCDEIWTYGLSNNQGGINPSFDRGVEYTGMGPFESFTMVQDGEGFHYANTWENQAKDVHPPLYYLFIHTVCSVFKGSFSKWYGIGVNLFWMILTIIGLYLLIKELTESVVATTGAVIAYVSSVVFLDTMLLIRMYAQFTFFVVLLMLLFKKNWDKKPEKSFLINLGVTLVLGMLSHYYFLLIAFFMCLAYGIKLIMSKDGKSVRNYIIALAVSGLVYGITWYHILAHIFNGYRGKEAISKATSLGGLISGVTGMLSILNSEAFAGIGIVFVLIGLCYVVVRVWKKQSVFSYAFIMFLCGLFYIVVVGKICPKITTRYIMPVGWIFIVSAYLAVRYLLHEFKAGKAAEYIVIATFCIISVFNLATRNFTVPMDYADKNQMAAVETAAGKKAVVYVDLDWKILYDFVILQNTDGYTFVDEENAQAVMDSQTGDYILIVNLEEGSEDVVGGLDSQLLYDDGMNYYYLVHANKR